MASFVITANRVADGGVVYLDADRAWTTRLAAAAAHPSPKAAEPELAWARTQEAVICDPHSIKVDAGPDGPRPLDTKQRIRAEGPVSTLRSLGFLPMTDVDAAIHRAELEG